ncbi:hypothetical protein [Salidesulfovibrio brasiliensis]|uniref:hypothetical protein n=1 Tax=Salidesulfovibrio brasiliensis TaxID=221711 RepID=UPI0006CFB950|nr:hypothetical protein [Salidesulfovibrio brasiliensis]
MGPKKREIPARCAANSAMVEKRIRDKLLDYERYAFDVRKSRALTIFFDLSQEFQSRDNFYAALIQILRMMFDLDAALYVLEDEETFVLASCSQDYALKPEITRTWEEGKSTRRTFSEGRVYLPIRCNPEFNDMLPFMPPDNVIGMLVVRLEDMEDEDLLLFLEKYANRIGFQLHNRILRDRSREHLDFIRNLVEDIGHNVIVPNIYFKLYFNRLRRLIESLGDLKKKAERSETITAPHWRATWASCTRPCMSSMKRYTATTCRPACFWRRFCGAGISRKAATFWRSAPATSCAKSSSRSWSGIATGWRSAAFS